MVEWPILRSRRKFMRFSFQWLFSLMICGGLWAADYRVGLARIDITPELPIWMSGYASRNQPAQSVLLPLSAKAMIIEDSHGKRVALVSTDIIGLPREISTVVAQQAEIRYQLKRSQLLLNSSHTHSGPVVRPNLSLMYDLGPSETEATERYRHFLTERLITVIGEALRALKPASLQIGFGRAGFAVNRRQFKNQAVQIGVNPDGPTDFEVPVLKAQGEDGRWMAVLFGYTCHNTTLGGDNLQIQGDYAGFAQQEWEGRHPGNTAMFFLLCAADQNPNPRGKIDQARQHGKELADAVDEVLQKPMKTIHGDIHAAFLETRLEFAKHTRDQFDEELKSKDVYRQRRARWILASYDRGKPIRSIPYPVQAIQLGKDFAIIALSGEVVIDYQLRIKQEFAGRPLMVCGYSNEVMCYIPSRRVLKEGGYEPSDSMIYYGMPGSFQETVEEQVMGAVYRVAAKIGWKITGTKK